ncbi:MULTISPECIES: YciI family protein [unclassified Erwinia]|uniref:YciI family protein n=1 Tax=unclassified Erwinia TaxID=2622719 RepID=UPI000C17C563|nr:MULTISPECIES: YciI family protein [unclassified Erwinia]PIJ48194.1 hypothetical protein BV501_18025 [Erwinia sp. OAMSP11]PIJ67729.1 hypothetical protein BK416_16825 [Erwinia sp. OLSSP12]PIJ78589.1 hypothetical protein BLD47_17080 [Erwinia sp. OLCASP19]PIJ79344.1 hypothetical protein BLD46_17245 [Erwinia sp. OLMTSP26]PIJ80604.1 hypothetical protein BLD49_17090 [Erwinia sp. OLMDSP33]
MDHPHGPEWDAYVVEHVRYLQTLLASGSLLASGPLKQTPLRAGFLIFRAPGIETVRELIAADPFAREGLIASLDIQQWDPLFGLLEDFSSQQLPPALAALTVKPSA